MSAKPPCITDYSELPHLRLHSLKIFWAIRLTGHFTAKVKKPAAIPANAAADEFNKRDKKG